MRQVNTHTNGFSRPFAPEIICMIRKNSANAEERHGDKI